MSTPWGACLPVFPCGWKSDYIIPSVHQHFLTSTPLSRQQASNCSPSLHLNKVILWGKKGVFFLICKTQRSFCFCAVQGLPVQEDQGFNSYTLCRHLVFQRWNSSMWLLCATEIYSSCPLAPLDGGLKSQDPTISHTANVNVSEPFRYQLNVREW